MSDFRMQMTARGLPLESAHCPNHGYNVDPSFRREYFAGHGQHLASHDRGPAQQSFDAPPDDIEIPKKGLILVGDDLAQATS